jgi:hypothetical protein
MNMAKYFTTNQFYKALGENGAHEAYTNSSAEIMLKPDVAIAAIKSGLNHIFLHVGLRENKDVIAACVEQEKSPAAFMSAAEKLKKDKDFVLRLGKICPEAFLHSNVEIDREFVLSVIDVAGEKGIKQLFWMGLPDKYAKDSQIKKALAKAAKAAKEEKEEEKENAEKGFSVQEIGRTTKETPIIDKTNVAKVENEANKDHSKGREGEN